MGLMDRVRTWIALRRGGPALAGMIFPYVIQSAELIGQKKYEEARERLLKALRFRDRIVDMGLVGMILDNLWLTYFLPEDHEGAIRFFNGHLAGYPKDVSALVARGTAHWYLGQLQEAADDYSRVLELMPGHVHALSGRGQVLVELGEYEKAIADLDAALQFYQSNDFIHGFAYVRNGRAAALAGLGELDQALQEFEMSIALAPENAWVYYNRAQAFERAQERDRAIADYRAALQKSNPRLNLPKREKAEAKLLRLSGSGRPN